MTRARLELATLLSTGLALAACGGSDGGEVAKCEVEGGEACFVPPSVAMTVTRDGSPGQVPNWDCGPPQTVLTTAPLTISGTISDFQTPTTTYEGAVIKSFTTLDFDGTPTATATSTTDGAYSLDIPAGGAANFMHFFMEHEDTLDTIAVYVPVDTSGAATTRNRNMVSTNTANAIPALLGITRIQGSGVIAGEVNDCDGNVVQNAIATISTTSGTSPAHVAGVQMYYFTSDLPVRRTAQRATNTDGLFVGIQIPSAASNYFVQAWGYKTEADAQSGNLTLIAEQEIPALPDTVVSTTMFPTTGTGN
jgi:hypothetical protein